MSSDDDSSANESMTVAPFDVEHGDASNVVVTQSNGSNRDAESLEEGESTAGPSQPNSLNSRLKGSEHSDSDGGDDFFATGKDQDFQCTVRCCSGYTAQERRSKKDRLLPCFVNGPVCCHKRGSSSARGVACCGQRFRCCGRVGNFTVLLERLRGSTDARRRELWLVMGPYWPFCLSLTTFLMLVLPLGLLVLFWNVIPRPALLAYLGFTVLALVALAAVACRDPGLVEHIPFEPPESVNCTNRRGKWVYNDLTESWRPRGAQYDRDINAVVRDFDHVCPFTGTAIGANNLVCFYAFVVMVQVLIYTSLAFLAWGVWTVHNEGYTPPTH